MKQLLQQLKAPQAIVLLGFLFFYPAVICISVPIALIASLAMTPLITDEGRYVSLGLCNLGVVFCLMLMSGTLDWGALIAITATLTWCFGKPIQKPAEEPVVENSPVSGFEIPHFAVPAVKRRSEQPADIYPDVVNRKVRRRYRRSKKGA